MATETESNKQTLFFVVLGQKYTTHKVWAKSETMRAGPLFRHFGVYMELLLNVEFRAAKFKLNNSFYINIEMYDCVLWNVFNFKWQ